MPRDPLSVLSEGDADFVRSRRVRGRVNDSDVQRCIALIDRLCSLLAASPTDPEIEAIRERHDVAVGKPQWSALSHQNGVTYRDVAWVADGQEREIGTLLLAYDRVRKERDEAKDDERELLFTERNLLSRLERAVAAQDKGDALRAALDDEALVDECYKPLAEEYPTILAFDVDAYRAKLREAGK